MKYIIVLPNGVFWTCRFEDQEEWRNNEDQEEYLESGGIMRIRRNGGIMRIRIWKNNEDEEEWGNLGKTKLVEKNILAFLNKSFEQTKSLNWDTLSKMRKKRLYLKENTFEKATSVP